MNTDLIKNYELDITHLCKNLIEQNNNANLLIEILIKNMEERCQND